MPKHHADSTSHGILQHSVESIYCQQGEKKDYLSHAKKISMIHNQQICQQLQCDIIAWRPEMGITGILRSQRLTDNALQNHQQIYWHIDTQHPPPPRPRKNKQKTYPHIYVSHGSTRTWTNHSYYLMSKVKTESYQTNFPKQFQFAIPIYSQSSNFGFIQVGAQFSFFLR